MSRNFGAILINLTTYNSRNDNNNTLRAFDVIFLILKAEQINKKNLHEVSANEHCKLYRDNKSVILTEKKRKENLYITYE